MQKKLFLKVCWELQYICSLFFLLFFSFSFFQLTVCSFSMYILYQPSAHCAGWLWLVLPCLVQVPGDSLLAAFSPDSGQDSRTRGAGDPGTRGPGDLGTCGAGDLGTWDRGGGLWGELEGSNYMRGHRLYTYK